MDATQIRQLQPQLRKYLRQFCDCFSSGNTGTGDDIFGGVTIIASATGGTGGGLAGFGTSTVGADRRHPEFEPELDRRHRSDRHAVDGWRDVRSQRGAGHTVRSRACHPKDARLVGNRLVGQTARRKALVPRYNSIDRYSSRGASAPGSPLCPGSDFHAPILEAAE